METIDPSIREFLEKLMQEKGIAVSDPDVREEMLNDLNQRLQAKLFAVILTKLQGPALKEFEKLLAETPPDPLKVQGFLQDKVPDAGNVFAQAMLEFRDAYLKP